MTTYHLRHNHFGHLHPFPFSTLEGAERFRVQLNGQDTYTVYELAPKVESEEEREEREEREFHEDAEYREWIEDQNRAYDERNQ